MAAHGPPPKPIEKCVREGNPDHKKIPQPMILLPGHVPSDLPEVPERLAARGSKMWIDIWAAGHLWLQLDMDGSLIEEVCYLSDEIDRWREEIDNQGRMLEEPIATPSGHIIGTRLVVNPAVNSLRKAEEARRKGLSELGFTPTSRARLGFIQVKAASQLEQLLQARSRGEVAS
jgi:P27 family predicted phage terminase small subunit